jgi:hypothetical protein
MCILNWCDRNRLQTSKWTADVNKLPIPKLGREFPVCVTWSHTPNWITKFRTEYKCSESRIHLTYTSSCDFLKDQNTIDVTSIALAGQVPESIISTPPLLLPKKVTAPTDQNDQKTEKRKDKWIGSLLKVRRSPPHLWVTLLHRPWGPKSIWHTILHERRSLLFAFSKPKYA